MAKKWDEQNHKAMRDLFGVSKDNRILDAILSRNKQSKRNQRTHAESVWKSSEEVFNGDGQINVCF